MPGEIKNSPDQPETYFKNLKIPACVEGPLAAIYINLDPSTNKKTSSLVVGGNFWFPSISGSGSKSIYLDLKNHFEFLPVFLCPFNLT